MQFPVIRGLIDRRILVNYRVKPEVLARLLPAPFRPKMVNGSGMAGVCLIRLKHIRPRFMPLFPGLSSENVAHRIAVEWDTNEGTKEFEDQAMFPPGSVEFDCALLMRGIDHEWHGRNRLCSERTNGETAF